MSRKRFVVECVWSGYTSSQSRPCHRAVTRYPEGLKKIHTIGFTDRTTMSVTVRPCEPRERITEIHGYDRLLSCAVAQKLEGWVNVNDIKIGPVN